MFGRVGITFIMPTNFYSSAVFFLFFVQILEQKEKNWWSKILNHKIIEKNAENRNQRLSPKIAAQKYKTCFLKL